mmetsp:Transcript_24907/g.56788  ORF Transcript_24907/g.56788 Transcript_24907/m.56788 type:complete len:88 (-) Transcript_24907:722-985(-)
MDRWMHALPDTRTQMQIANAQGGAAQSTTVRMVGAVSSNSMCGPVFGIHESSSRDPTVCVIHAPETKGHVTNAPEAKGHVIVDQVVT